MNPALIAAMVALVEELDAAYKKYNTAKASIPTAADVDAEMKADVASIESSIASDRAAADLGESIKFPDDKTPVPK